MTGSSPSSMAARGFTDQIRTKRNDIVLDPFCGSGTTILAADPVKIALSEIGHLQDPQGFVIKRNGSGCRENLDGLVNRERLDVHERKVPL